MRLRRRPARMDRLRIACTYLNVGSAASRIGDRPLRRVNATFHLRALCADWVGSPAKPFA